MNDKKAPLEIIKHRIETDPDLDLAELDKVWNNWINGTLFHSPSFMAYHHEGKFEHHNLGFRRKGNLVGYIFGAIRNIDGAKTWVSHPGASYGGPTWSPNLKYYQLEDLVRALVDHSRKTGFEKIIITPPPVIYNELPEQALDFALFRNGFRIIRQELTQAVRLDFDEATLLDSFVNKTRTAIRKAIKLGLKFRIIENPTEAEFDRFWEILVENRRGLGVVPAHSREEIEKLHGLVPENLMMAVIEKDGKMVSVIWNFICNKHTVLEFYMAHEADAQIFRPVPFLTYHTLVWAKRRGFKWLDFGISSIDGEPTWGLMKFKENFMAKHFLRQSWQLNLGD